VPNVIVLGTVIAAVASTISQMLSGHVVLIL
jgi:hypothetical protein